MIYEPQEDSYLLQKAVQCFAEGNVLDLGTGSGIQAMTAAEKKEVRKVLAVDIQKSVIDYCKKNYAHIKKNRDMHYCKKDDNQKNKQDNLKKIAWLQSDLFSKIPKQKFDTIIFNPPYLPQDQWIEDRTIYGGKKGYEMIEHAFESINEYLNKDGIVLLLFSSLTNKKKIEEILFNHCMTWRQVEKQHISFEDLFVYKIMKSKLRKILETKRLSDVAYFAKGKRGILYKAVKNKKIIIIKAQHPDNKIPNTLSNEACWMQRLNKKGIGPKYEEHGDNFVMYQFVFGKEILDWIEKEKSNKKIKKILLSCLQQCRIMDELKVDKEEMHHPVKHILIEKEKPVFIDFERCRNTISPKNVTQFCQFLCNGKVQELLREKGIGMKKERLRSLAKQYKDRYDKENFSEITEYVMSC